MRIVFASLGSLGDLHPLMALARAAEARGHETVMAASCGYRSYVNSLGFSFHAIRPALEADSERREHLSHPTRGPERFLREEIFPSVRETYADLREAARGADLLVVGELLYVGPLVADRMKIPWANVILSPSSFLSACDPCVLAPAPWMHRLRRFGTWPHELIFALGRSMTSRWGAPLQALREELGYPRGPSPVFEGKHSPRLVLAGFPSFFAAPQRDWPAAVVQTGFPFFSQPVSAETRERIAEFAGSGEPPVVFTLGSIAVDIARDFYDCAIEAARKAGRRAILLLGKNPVPAAAGTDTLCLAYAPLDTVLPGAAAVVHHGGIGTCAEALRFGVPSLVIPFGFDQPDNAARLARIGAGHVLPRHRFSKKRLATALEQLLASAAIRVRVRETAKQIRPDQEMKRSLDALETLAASRPRRHSVHAEVC
ncbi:MAG TPA: glycosyltransferase [Terrimicrobiaceae bacterium]|nr:glycosyltransferase [Terrimicrobiaceae bacterium]